MSELELVTCALGGALVILALASLYAPDAARRAWLGFARHDAAGWALTATGLAWACWLLLKTPPFSAMPRIEPMVYVGGPLAFFILVIFLDEMLAARALGGILLLLASPVLTAARMSESQASVVMTLLGYAGAIYGMVLVVSPFRLRRLAESVTADRNRFRAGNLAALAAGGLLLALGAFVY